ncbi:hypothetical protein YS40_058 [Thermus phage phiYS40]|uniref:hypothetical protein n=1 Tax=Thermus phage phiYS40 TaxID=407392 RepID=UPI0000E689B0|nr:hypothetical protein YS40_058 [Thermus phage phiYS40]ABJ91452.1 hypothetical protein YS40_058 [Thermus phage phiYS40]BAK53576.1 hypothetical protein YSP_058 [Thermus phage phiYS40]
MNLVDIISFFGTTGSQLPFNIKEEEGKYYLINNPNNKVNNIPLSDGIYFEVIQGTLDNQNGLTQNLVVKLRNPNNIQIASSYVVRLYNAQNGALLFETYVPTSFDGLEVSFSTNVNVPLITIEANGLVLYTSYEYLNGYIPLDQRIYASFRDPNNIEVFRAFFVRKVNNKRYFTSTFRSVYNKFLNSSAIPFRFLDAYLNNTIIGNFNYQIITEFKFPQQYRFISEQESLSISAYSIMLLAFYKDFVEKLSGFLVDEVDFSQLDKDSRNFPYKKYFYNKNTLSYEKVSSYVDITELLLAILLGIKIYGMLDSSKQIIDNLVNALNTFSPTVYYPDASVGSKALIPDIINSNVEEQYSLFTNVLFAHILNLLGIDNSTLIDEINRVFVNNSKKTENRSLGTINSFTPLEAAVILKFAPQYLDTSNNYVSSLISSATSHLYSVEYVNSIALNSDANSDSYNPIYSENLSSALPFYDKRTYVNLIINSLLDNPINNFRAFSSDEAILDSYKYSIYEGFYILPSLRANLTYFFLSMENAFEGRVEEKSEVVLIDSVISVGTNQLIVELIFNKPVKILSIISNQGVPTAYASSMSESAHHVLTFSVINTYLNGVLEIYVLS